MVEGQASVYIFNNSLAAVQSGWVNIQSYAGGPPTLNSFSFNALNQGGLSLLGNLPFTAERILGGYLPAPSDRDMWKAGITLGPNSQYDSGAFKRCDIEARSNNRCIVLTVSENRFTIGMVSGPVIAGSCDTPMQPEQNVVLAGPVYVYVFNNCLQTIQSGNWTYKSTGGSNVSSGVYPLTKGSLSSAAMIDAPGTQGEWWASLTLADGSRYHTVRSDRRWSLTSADESRYVILMVSELSLDILKDSGAGYETLKKV